MKKQESNHLRHYEVPEALLQKIQAEFWAGCCDDEKATATIKSAWEKTGYLCDPHTAAGWAVAEEYRAATNDERPMVVLSTASPYKFPGAVLRAIARPDSDDEFAQMEQLSALTGVPIPENLSGLQEKPERHTDVIEKTQMLAYVKEKK